jgi:hypothetical protein
MVGNWATSSQTAISANRVLNRRPILRRGVQGRHHACLSRLEDHGETRIKPYLEQKAEQDAREEQRRLTRRNQALGLVLIAAAILVWRLFHTNPTWIFPSGWWRL